MCWCGCCRSSLHWRWRRCWSRRWYCAGDGCICGAPEGEEWKGAFRPLLPDVQAVTFNDFADLERITRRTACVLAEPVQGEAGVRPPHPGYLEALPRWTELVRGRAQQLCAACPEGLRSWLEALLDGLSAQLAELLESMGQRCLRAVTAAAAALPQAVLFCATTLLAVLFTAGSYPRIRAFLRRQLPEDRLRQARGVKADLLATLGKWCKAQCILLGVTFCELLTGFLLLRQGYALLLAALIAVIDALPVFGTGTVLVPWGALCLLTGNVPKGLGLLALYGVISLVRSVLEPKIMAAQVDLPPLAALAAMYVGFCAFGVAGMVLCPMALLFVKQLHDSGWLRLWK